MSVFNGLVAGSLTLLFLGMCAMVAYVTYLSCRINTFWRKTEEAIDAMSVDTEGLPLLEDTCDEEESK